MVATLDVQLFNQVVANPTHVVAPLIPPSKSHSYNLRKRPHDLQRLILVHYYFNLIMLFELDSFFIDK